MAFTQTAHSLAPVKVANLMSVDNARKKFPIVPISAADVTPAYLGGPIVYTGGAYGDDVALAKANATTAYKPTNQAEKATLPGDYPPAGLESKPIDPNEVHPDYTFAKDITAPRGYIGPQDPYSKAQPPAPVITSLAPNTAVAGSPSPLATVITGTGFTPWTIILTGGVQSPYAKYVSPTKMTLMMDPARSVAGTVNVVAVDHSVASAPSVFTYT